MFLNAAFAGLGQDALSNTTASEEEIIKFTLSNMVLDEIYATKKILLNFDWNIPTDWDFDTYLHGLYQNNTYAGNVDYSESFVSKVKIKKRLKGEFTWKTIYERPITCNEDFSISIYDYYEPSNAYVEYAYVPVIKNADAPPVSTEVYSKFDSYFFVDKETSIPAIFNPSSNISYNRESNTVVSPGSKYPYVISNGVAKYYSGSLQVSFIEMEDCQLNIEDAWKYRKKVDEFMANGKAKILKTWQGEMWMVNTTGNIDRTSTDDCRIMQQTVNWVECGDPYSIGDLYDHGFIDTDTDRE